MIWSGGEILPDDGLAIDSADRTFEHGLGLFETLRTWGGRPTLLGAHRARMLRSAEELGIPIDPASFPDEGAVARLLEAEAAGEDRLLRITATGGTSDRVSVVWMRSRSLGPAPREAVRVALGPWSIDHDDPLARHKTLNYWSRRIAREAAIRRGFDEMLGQSRGGFCEGSYTNVFIVQAGELTTPSMNAPIIPGVMRRLVLDLAREIHLAPREIPGIKPGRLRHADEVFLTNSVRGIIPVGRAEGYGYAPGGNWDAPGPWTRKLQAALADRMGSGGISP